MGELLASGKLKIKWHENKYTEISVIKPFVLNSCLFKLFDLEYGNQKHLLLVAFVCQLLSSRMHKEREYAQLKPKENLEYGYFATGEFLAGKLE